METESAEEFSEMELIDNRTNINVKMQANTFVKLVRCIRRRFAQWRTSTGKHYFSNKPNLTKVFLSISSSPLAGKAVERMKMPPLNMLKLGIRTNVDVETCSWSACVLGKRRGLDWDFCQTLLLPSCGFNKDWIRPRWVNELRCMAEGSIRSALKANGED